MAGYVVQIELLASVEASIIASLPRPRPSNTSSPETFPASDGEPLPLYRASIVRQSKHRHAWDPSERVENPGIL
jgi:hypothetical protein